MNTLWQKFLFIGKPKLEDLFIEVMKEKDKENDEVETFLNQLGLQLRKLPTNLREKYQRKFARVVDDSLEKLEESEEDENFKKHGYKITYSLFQ